MKDEKKNDKRNLENGGGKRETGRKAARSLRKTEVFFSVIMSSLKLIASVYNMRTRVWQVGFVVDKMAPGKVFSEYFGFPCQPHFIPPTSPSSQSPGTGTIGQYMAVVPRGRPIWTPPPTIRIKKKNDEFDPLFHRASQVKERATK
jgi:hypothetical protein